MLNFLLASKLTIDQALGLIAATVAVIIFEIVKVRLTRQSPKFAAARPMKTERGPVQLTTMRHGLQRLCRGWDAVLANLRQRFPRH
jgi:hypothetical protein